MQGAKHYITIAQTAGMQQGLHEHHKSSVPFVEVYLMFIQPVFHFPFRSQTKTWQEFSAISTFRKKKESHVYELGDKNNKSHRQAFCFCEMG